MGTPPSSERTRKTAWGQRQRGGAAYVFERNKDGGGTTADNWGQVQKLTASDTGDDDYFGRSVAISGDTVVVGAWGENGAGGDDRGAAYVFERNEAGPAPQPTTGVRFKS